MSSNHKRVKSMPVVARDEADKADRNGPGQVTPSTPPKRPNPSLDPGVVPPITSPTLPIDTTVPQDDDFEVATMEAVMALKLLSKGIQNLTAMTGDVPPTPPVSRPPTPPPDDRFRVTNVDSSRPVSRSGAPASSVPSHDLKAPTYKTVPIGSPEAHETEPTVLVSEGVTPARTQYETIARKFYSKKPPPISIDDYLLRLHRYCPMSTAVYLAAGAYIHKLGVEEKTVPVTARTVHRLLLASLRIAMKALEDLSYPHQRFAGVGGVSERELAKLEISLCYLTNFELKVDNALLYQKTKALLQLSKTSSKPLAKPVSLPIREKSNRRVTIS